MLLIAPIRTIIILVFAKPEADILIFLKNNPEYNKANDIVKFRGFSKAHRGYGTFLIKYH